MKVIAGSKKVDCYSGDIVKYDSTPCMVIELGLLGDENKQYGLVALEGLMMGVIIKTTKHLGDMDKLVNAVLIPKEQVVISREEE